MITKEYEMYPIVRTLSVLALCSLPQLDFVLLRLVACLFSCIPLILRAFGLRCFGFRLRLAFLLLCLVLLLVNGLPFLWIHF